MRLKDRLVPFGVLAACAASGTFAQDQQKASTGLTEVVVTARKVEERLLDVPLSVTAFTAEQIEKQGLRDIRDVVGQTPGVFLSSTSGRSGDRLSIRGLSSVVPTSGFVGVYVDNVYVSGSATGVDFSTIERVEVLKGPQGALFGRGTLSGVVKYVTQRPTDELNAKVKASFGEFGEYDVSGVLRGPINDQWGFIVGARTYERDDTFRNSLTGRKELGGESTTSGTVGLQWKPSDTFSAYLRVLYVKDEDSQRAVFSTSSLENNCLPRTPTDLKRYYCGEIVADPSRIRLANSNAAVPAPFVGRFQSSDGKGGLDRTAYRGMLELDWELPWATLTSVTSYTDEKQRDGFDLTYRGAFTYANPPPAGANIGAITFDRDIDFQDFSQELRLTSRDSGRLGWLFGAYFFDNDQKTVNTYRLPPADDQGTLSAKNFAVFGRVEYDLTDSLRIGLDGRWQDDKNSYVNRSNNITAEVKTSGFIPRVTADWKFAEGKMLYALYSKGNRPATLNVDPGLPAALRPTKEEETTNYEVGFKGRFLDDRVQLTAAAYFIDWKNQLYRSACAPGECGGNTAIITYNANVGKAEVRGYELDLTAQVIPDLLTVRLGYSVNDTKVKEFRTATASEATEGLLSFAGTGKVAPICIAQRPSAQAVQSAFCPAAATGFVNTLQGAIASNIDTSFPAQPEYQFTASADLGSALPGSAMRWFVRPSMTLVSRQFESIYNLAYTAPATSVNLRMGLETDNWEVALWGRNLTDEKTPTAILRGVAFQVDGPGRTINDRAFAAFLRDPRQFGVSFSYAF